MKMYADKRKLSHKFQLGDLVFVKLRPYRQHSLARHRFQKLSKRYFGPYKLLRQIGPVAFELELPPHSKIHPVFHVSQLKPYHGSNEPTNELHLEHLRTSQLYNPWLFWIEK